MAHRLDTIVIKASTLGRLSKAYISLAFRPEQCDRSRIAALDRYGSYEVRLMEFAQGGQAGDSRLWLELYCYDTKTSLDSYLCDGLDDAETVADHLISSAKQLHDKTE